MKSTARILLIANSFAPRVGGYEAIALFLAEGLGRVYQTTVLTQTAGGGDEKFPFQVLRNPTPQQVREFGRNADLIILNSMSLRFLGLLIPHRGKMVVVHHNAYDEKSSPKVRMLELLKRVASRFMPLNICVSRFVASRLWGPRIVIHNPYDESLFDARRRESVRAMLFVGRLTHDKGADLLIEAFAALRPRRPGWTLSIFGDGPERCRLESMVSAKGLDGDVHFTRSADRARIASEMRRHPILVVPSRRETYGIVLLEGLASGCRVVHSDAGGLPEAAGALGIAYAAGSVQGLIQALEAALDEVSLPQQRSSGLNGFLEEHSRPRVMAKYLEIVERQLQRVADRDKV